MPVMNRLQTVLRARGIENPNQFRVATKKADPEGKGLSPGASLSAWKNPYWVPAASSLQLICRTFGIQPGDFLFYVPDEKEVLEDDQTSESLQHPKTFPRLDVAIHLAKYLQFPSLEEFARSLGLDP